MKKIIMSAVALLLIMPATLSAATIKGSDNIISKSITLTQAYTEIEVSRGVKVKVEERTDNEVIIYANDNVMPYVEFEIDEGELEISIDDDIKSLNKVTVIVSLPANAHLTKIEASSAADVQIQTELNVKVFKAEASSAAEISFSRANVETFSLDASSSANIKGVIKADNGYMEATSAADIDVNILAVRCSAKASSAADIILKGQVGTFYAEASSASGINAEECLALEMANVKASSGAKITVNNAKQLSAKASSGGSVRYTGEGSVTPDASSGGSIKPL